MDEILGTWYDWGVFVGVFVAAAITIYIFFDAQELGDPQSANMAKAGAAIGLVLTLPSLYERLTASDILGIVIIESENGRLFGYLGLLGVLSAIVTLVYYYSQVRSVSGGYPAESRNLTEQTRYPTPTPSPSIPPPPINPPTPSGFGGQGVPGHRPVPATQPINQEPPAAAWLVVRSGNRVGTQHQLSIQKSKTIGRDPSRADIVLDDDTVSREHARIQYENGQFVLYDLASTSGTYINGNIIQRQMLYDDDRVSLGRIELVYKKAS